MLDIMFLNSKTMKRITCFSMIILIFGTCRSFRESRITSYSAADRQYRREEQHHTLLFRQQDSATHSWHFRTDSLFYFHPDSGLYGWSGSLRVAGGRKRDFSCMQTADSVYMQFQAAESTWMGMIKKTSRWHVGFVVWGGLLFFILVVWARSVRRWF